MRDSVEGPRRIVPRDQWSFTRAIGTSRDAHDARSSSRGRSTRSSTRRRTRRSSASGRPRSATSIAMLKYKSADALGRFPPARSSARSRSASRRAAASCAPILYYGFNADEGNRKVFDGVIAHVAGAGRGSFNHRFAQPSRDGHPYINFFYPTDIFPFTDVAQKDPETGVTDGLLTHAGIAGAAAEDLLHELVEYEYWGRAASLIHTTVDGAGGRAADGQRPHLSARRRAARPGARSRRRRRSASSGTTRSTTGGR